MTMTMVQSHEGMTKGVKLPMQKVEFLQAKQIDGNMPGVYESGVEGLRLVQTEKRTGKQNSL